MKCSPPKENRYEGKGKGAVSLPKVTLGRMAPGSWDYTLGHRDWVPSLWSRSCSSLLGGWIVSGFVGSDNAYIEIGTDIWLIGAPGKIATTNNAVIPRQNSAT